MDAQKIKGDLNRFKQIVRGKIKKNFSKYIKKGEMIGKRGKDMISIPLPEIETPRFRYGSKDSGGIGQGEGEVGDAMGPGEPQPGEGPGAGDQPGDHILEVEITIEELAQIMGEELQLPRIEPRGRKKVQSVKDKYTGIHRVGPESLRHFKRTYREALKRQIASGTYNPERPVIIPVKEDKRYRSWKTVEMPSTNAVILYMMDVSGSMGVEQKEIVRIESFWLDTWLQTQYKGLETRYIIHDATAREVDSHTFFHTRESGGTMISSAYTLCDKIIDADYPPGEWNIYPFHFSDGDNWSGDDTSVCIKLLKEKLLPKSNQFAYGQVESPYGSGQFIKDLNKNFPDTDNLVTSEIKDRNAIMNSIKDFLGRGR